jgi:SAM-dependent methyltransferase
VPAAATSEAGPVSATSTSGRAAPSRLNWGCGRVTPAGWVNSDRKRGPGVDLSCDIRDGLPLTDASFDYVVSIHALQDLPYREVLPALRELRRVLRPAGVLRLGLPDLGRAVQAYVRGDREFFIVPDDEVRSLGGKLCVQMLWYGSLRSLFTDDFVAELLGQAGFGAISRCRYRETASPYPEIVELDNRERESLFVEAVK